MMKYPCQPDWYDDDDGWAEIEADDPQEAATRFAEKHDSDSSEYPAHQRVRVRSGCADKIYDVYGESVREYRARIAE